MKGTMKIFASVVSVLLMFAGAFAFLEVPARAKVRTGEIPPPIEVGAFHVNDRMVVEMGEYGSPHKENPRLRAFLNQHGKALDCSVCHLDASGARIAKLADGKLALATGGKAVKEGEPGVSKKVRYPYCSECHKRGSKILVENYYGPRLRVLEDLSILRYIEGG